MKTPELIARVLELARTQVRAGWTPSGTENEYGEPIGRCSVCKEEGPKINFCGQCRATFLTDEQIAKGELNPRSFN